MKSATSLQTLITSIPVFDNDHLAKRAEVTCGELIGYKNVQAPVCTGLTSICTFSDYHQGCCDSSGTCQFYTTCNGLFAATVCIDSYCLSCSQSAPYCIKYEFWHSDLQRIFDGYSCAIFEDTSTVWGKATSMTDSASTTSSSSISTITTSESSHSNIRVSESKTATSTPTPSSIPKSKSHTGSIVGGVVGAGLGSILIIGAFFVYKKRLRGRNRNPLTRDDGPEIQQHYQHGSLPTAP